MKQILPSSLPAAPASAWAALRPRRAPRQPICQPVRLLSSSATVRQVHPRGAYYDILITSPPPYTAHAAEPEPERAATTPDAEDTPADTPAAAEPADAATTPAPAQMAQQRARIVFGSRLVGPAERANRLAELRLRSRRIAGVLVPPKPEEPDNCCMSGCVNCVWDRFRDEMEAWAAASAEASRRLQAQEGGAIAAEAGSGSSSGSMDDDGGGSETNWSPEALAPAPATGGSGWAEDLYKDVPVGIREFMRQEKRLKLKHIQDGTMGG